MPTHYFVHLGQSTQTKNALQAEFYEYLQEFRGTLIDTQNLSALEYKILVRASQLNEKHKRCTPLQIEFHARHDQNGKALNGFPFLSFNILNAQYDEQF